jgi:uncharacterized membrane protein YkoI
MRYFIHIQNRFSRWKKIAIVLYCLLFFGLCISLSACQKTVDYYDYVSECRSNIFLAETDGFSFRAYALVRETPYASDGVVMQTAPRFETYFIAPSGDKECKLTFRVDGKEYGGDMSYDNVKAEYYYFCSLDLSTATEIDVSILYGEASLSLKAKSVLQGDILSPKAVLEQLCLSENQFFTELTDEYGFAGEIYVRLLYEDDPFYYVGVIAKDGKTTAFLLNAKTGKVLAKRQS